MRLLVLGLFWGVMVVSSWAGADFPVPGAVAKKFLNLDGQNQYVGLRDYVGVQASKPPQLLLLSFWSVTCVPCRKEMPVLQAWTAKHPGDVEVLFINVDKKDSGETVRKYREQFNVQGQVLFDFYQATAKSYGVCDGSSCSLPALFVVNSQGVIEQAIRGFEGAPAVESLLEATLQKQTRRSSLAEVPAKAKAKTLHNILSDLDLNALSQKYHLSREQVLQILQEADAAASKQWGL